MAKLSLTKRPRLVREALGRASAMAEINTSSLKPYFCKIKKM